MYDKYFHKLGSKLLDIIVLDTMDFHEERHVNFLIIGTRIRDESSFAPAIFRRPHLYIVKEIYHDHDHDRFCLTI